MEFIIRLLAQLFAVFKAKNPLVATLVLLASSAAVYTANQGQLYGLFTLPEWAKSIVQIGGLLVTALTGSETYKYLNGQK